MIEKANTVAGSEFSTTSSLFGFCSAILTTIITLVTFGFAMVAVPISGANCPGDCVEYPY